MGNKGFEAALAAVEMASLKKAISSPASGVRQGLASDEIARARMSKNKRRNRPDGVNLAAASESDSLQGNCWEFEPVSG